MRGVLLIWRSELGRHWRGLAVVALVVATAGAVTLAALAGARRTSSSFERFLDESRSQDAIVFADDVRPADVARLRSLPGVESIGYGRQLSVLRPDGQFLAVGGALDDSIFRDIYRLRVVDGRAPAPGAADEVVLGEPLARSIRLGVGDSLPLRSYTQEQVDQIIHGAEVSDPAGPRIRLHVVGISRAPNDLSLQGSDGGILLLTRPFVEKYGGAIGNFSGEHGAVLLARLSDGSAGVPRFLGQLRRVLGDRHFDVDPAALSTGGVQESIDLIAIAVLAFGAVAGAAGLIALALIAGRQVALTGARQGPLRDLGLARPLRAAAAGGPVLLAVGVGALGATILAWGASPLFPFGVAGDAEPDPGLHLDTLVLGTGTVAIVVLLGAVVSVASWRSARASAASTLPSRTSMLARTLEARAFTPPATVGVRLALERGNGPTAVPVRSSLVGMGLAVLGVTAVAIFAASLATLGQTPRAYGQSWDVRVTDARARLGRRDRVCSRVETRLLDDSDVAAIASACTLNIAVNGRAIGAFAITPLRGSMEPTVLDGRSPRRADEIALGAQTLDALHLDLGDRVTGRTPAGTVKYRVVGRVVVPALSDPQALADGAVLTGAGLDRLDIPDDNLGSFSLVLRFRPGVDRAGAIARIRGMPDIGSFGEPGVATPTTRLEVERLRQVDQIPVVLASFLALVGAIAVGHLLVTSVHRRRRDFAVLKSIGFTRRQVGLTVAWQATTVAAFGVLVGLGVGLAAGTLLWRAAAERVGVLAIVDVPVAVLAGVAIGAFGIANLVAAIPARTAARTQPAVALRTE